MMFLFRCLNFEEQRVRSLLGISYMYVEASFFLFYPTNIIFIAWWNESHLFATFELKTVVVVLITQEYSHVSTLELF